MYKKTLYILAFAFLGLLVSFLVHAVLEMVMIELLIADIDRYGLGLSLSEWQVVHDVGTPLLLLVGVGIGLWQGWYWWHEVYIEKRRGLI